jgi:hypothetical protein
MQSKLVTFLQQTPCMQLAKHEVRVTHADLDFRVSQEWRGAGCVHGQLGQRPTYMVASHASLLRHASLSLVPKSKSFWRNLWTYILARKVKVCSTSQGQRARIYSHLCAGARDRPTNELTSGSNNFDGRIFGSDAI